MSYRLHPIDVEIIAMQPDRRHEGVVVVGMQFLLQRQDVVVAVLVGAKVVLVVAVDVDVVVVDVAEEPTLLTQVQIVLCHKCDKMTDLVALIYGHHPSLNRKCQLVVELDDFRARRMTVMHRHRVERDVNPNCHGL